MRWIFWLLLVANVLVVIWHNMIAAPQENSPRPHIRDSAKSDALRVESISLLNELDPAGVRLLKQSDQISQVNDPAVCLMVGPFASAGEIQQFIARLAALDVKSFEHFVDLPAGEGYWVYLEPMTNRDVARRRLAELHARGLDSYIIPRGELENGISLGVFTRRDLAEARLRELAKLGLAPKLQNIGRSYRELWVMLGHAEEHKIGEAAWQSLMRDYFSLQQKQNLCSDVASTRNFH